MNINGKKDEDYFIELFDDSIKRAYSCLIFLATIRKVDYYPMTTKRIQEIAQLMKIDLTGEK